MSTAAKTKSVEGSHFYFRDGQPCYEVPYADPRKGMRPTTLADARKLDLLPSTTTILKVLWREGLVNFFIESACLAVLTSPRVPGEELDAFVHRILHVDKVQDEESTIAKDRGTELHAALDGAFQGQPIEDELLPWVHPAFASVLTYGQTVATEKVVVGDGYAGRVDLIQETPDSIIVWDHKSAKKLPERASWPDHKLQLSSYAAAIALKGSTSKPIKTANCYISTTEPGKFVIFQHDDWEKTYRHGFYHILQVWKFLNNFGL